MIYFFPPISLSTSKNNANKMIQDNPPKKYWWKTEEKPKMEINYNFSHQLIAWHGKTNDFATITFFPFPPFWGDWWHVHIHVSIYILHKMNCDFFRHCYFCCVAFVQHFTVSRPIWQGHNGRRLICHFQQDLI